METSPTPPESPPARLNPQAETMQMRLPWHVRLLAPALTLFFRLLYHEFAWSYDLVAAFVSVGMWNGWIGSVIPFINGPRVLELGHGPGHLQRGLHASAGQAGAHPVRFVFGLDRSPQMGRQAGRRLHKAGFQPALVNGSAMALPYADGSFQTIVATFPNEYIIHPDTLAEVYRVLSPSGRFVVLAGAWITGKSILQRLAALLFKVTGQSPDWDNQVLEPPRGAGFEMQLEWVDLPSSRVLVAIGIKPS